MQTHRFDAAPTNQVAGSRDPFPAVFPGTVAREACPVAQACAVASPGGLAAPDTRPANTRRWYAIRTRSRFEERVAAGLTRGGIESYLPVITREVRWSDRVKTHTLPLFAGYLFARFERFADAAQILSVVGVFQILGNNEFDSISDDVMETLHRIVESPAPVLPLPYVQPGSPVRVRCGYFTDCVGVVVRLKGSVRLVVSIPMLGQSVSVELDARDVRPEPAA
jgi:transcription antitermination factor NusG